MAAELFHAGIQTDGQTERSQESFFGFFFFFAKVPARTEANQRLRIHGELAGIRTSQSIALPLQ